MTFDNGKTNPILVSPKLLPSTKCGGGSAKADLSAVDLSKADLTCPCKNEVSRMDYIYTIDETKKSM